MINFNRYTKYCTKVSLTFLLTIALCFVGFIESIRVDDNLELIYRHDANVEDMEKLGSEMNGVVNLIGGPDRGHFGSGVFVAENWVLTAAHNIRDNKFGVMNAQKRLMRIDTVIIHPKAGELTGNVVDLALIKVQGRSEEISSISDTPLKDLEGKEIAIAGFGIFQSANSVGMPDIHDRKLRAGTNIIDQIGGEVQGRKHSDWSLIYDLDKPGDEKINALGSAEPTSLESIGNGGDSGGGVFLKTSEGWSLVGITEGSQINITKAQDPGIRFYGTIASASAVSPHMDWILQTIE